MCHFFSRGTNKDVRRSLTLLLTETSHDQVGPSLPMLWQIGFTTNILLGHACLLFDGVGVGNDLGRRGLCWCPCVGSCWRALCCHLGHGLARLASVACASMLPLIHACSSRDSHVAPCLPANDTLGTHSCRRSVLSKPSAVGWIFSSDKFCSCTNSLQWEAKPKEWARPPWRRTTCTVQ